jgi:DNA-binding response OmpR family regulator
MTKKLPHLLVIDDDTRLRTLLGRFLGENGFDVALAKDTDEARGLMLNTKFDLLIVDVMMPINIVDLPDDAWEQLKILSTLKLESGDIICRAGLCPRQTTFEIAKVAVAANSLVTIKAWMRRTNSGLTTGLRIKGGQIGGVTNDITSYMTAAADTWEQVTLTFTPTEIGVVEILAECYGGSTYTAYVDDLTISQA